MLLNYYIGIAIPFIAGIGVIALFAWLWKKMKKKPVAGGTIGFFIGVIVSIALYVIPTKVYVVTGNKEMTKYISFGSSAYTMENGREVQIDSQMAACKLINDSNEDVVLEHVIYGFGAETDNFVEAGTALDVDDPAIDHFFDEIPPETIETSGSGTYAVRLWLRMADDYDADYIDSDELDNLRNLLEGAMEE